MRIKKNGSFVERLTALGVGRSALIVFVLSFAGWCFEKVGRYLIYNSITDRGFLTLPLCPIYGFSVLIIYLLIGSPDIPAVGVRQSGLVARLMNFIIYFLLALSLTTAIELVTGVFFKEVMGIPLWNYEDRFMDLLGYICLGYSLLWGGLISLFMLLVWTPLCRIVRRINHPVARVIGAFCLLLMTCDFVFNIIYAVKTGSHFNFL